MLGHYPLACQTFLLNLFFNGMRILGMILRSPSLQKAPPIFGNNSFFSSPYQESYCELNGEITMKTWNAASILDVLVIALCFFFQFSNLFKSLKIDSEVSVA